MANLFAVPAPVVGLMGRRPQSGRSILDMINPMQADALDEQMFAAAPNGYVESPQGMYFPADQAAQAQAMQQMQPGPQAPAQRQRVSALNVLGRAFAPNITGALDSERARLQAEADRPGQLSMSQENERIARALGPQALLAMRLAPKETGDSLSYGLRPQVIGQGGIQSVAATGQRVSAPKDFTAGTGVYRSDPLSAGLQQLGEIGPTYTEQNAAERNRIDAIGAGQSTVDSRYRIDAEGNVVFEAPDVTSLGAGDTRYVNGVATAIGAPKERPVPDAVRRDNEKDETAIGDRQATIDRVTNAIGLIDNGMINLDPVSRASAWARNRSGNSSPESRAQAELKRTVETLRNNILNDATGPQTDGDSLRALNQILDGWGDEKVVRDGLSTFVGLQNRKNEIQRGIMERRLSSYGDPAASYGSGQRNIPPPPPGFVLD